jgi:DNA-3-methyladenine glycosylase
MKCLVLFFEQYVAESRNILQIRKEYKVKRFGMTKIPLSFYKRPDVVQISRELIGKYLFTYIDGVKTGGMIVETEAYSGYQDRACHAHLGRRTSRTEIMFQEGGLAYVYLIYGMYNLFNIVTNQEGNADAVLIRAIQPTEGIEWMLERRSLTNAAYRLTAGPGVMSQALGIERKHYGLSLDGDTIWLEDRNVMLAKNSLQARPRVGVAYAEEDALLPWRFNIKDNPWISKTVTNYGNRINSPHKK